MLRGFWKYIEPVSSADSLENIVVGEKKREQSFVYLEVRVR
jgi:hypothetical protein